LLEHASGVFFSVTGRHSPYPVSPNGSELTMSCFFMGRLLECVSRASLATTF
jgi:hypothetical protein